MKHLLPGALLLALTVAVLNAPSPAKAEEKPRAADGDDAQDVLYVGQPYPVLLRLRLRVGNKPALAKWEGFMETFFHFLDRNKSGTLDRIEGGRAPLAAQMSSYYVGNPFTVARRSGPGMASSPFNDMDANRDGKVTLAELKDYYRANNAGPILLQSTQAPRVPQGLPQTAATDPLFELLDSNKDGKLSRDELEAALKTLTRHDVNDDELVSLAELNMGVAGTAFQRLRAAQAALPNRNAQRQNQAAAPNLVLVPREQGKRMTEKLAVARDLIQRLDKDKDGRLTRDEIGLPQAAFDAISRRRDGKATALELARWLAGKPDAEFTVKAGTGGAAMMRRPVAATGQPRPNADEMSVSLEGVSIRVVSTGGAGRFSYKQYLSNQFKQLDEGGKGFITRKQLDEQQFAYMRGLFDFADRNADNRLTEAELKALLDVMEAGQGAQLTLALAPSGQGLFQMIDANADGNLSVRELRSACKRLTPLDKDGDGCVDRREFPQQYLLTVAQGPNYGYVPPYAYTDPNSGSRAAGPVWFRKMDRNGDGDVSRLEWLGTKEDFDQADADRDGLISLREAETLDARLRKK